MSSGPLRRIAPAHHAIASLHAPSAARLELARSVPTPPEAPAVALTFDDGPHPEGTPAILECLAAHHAQATFFVVGEQVRRRPALVARILAEGHAVGLHGDRHQLQTRRRRADLAEDLFRGIAAVQDAGGVPVRRHRPPYGIYSPAGLELVRDAGLDPLLWASWGKDWRRFTRPAWIAANALRRTGSHPGDPVTAGDVILLHDADFYSATGSHRRTAAALAIILGELARRGLGTVTAG